MASDTIKLNWRKSETHGLEDDPEPRPIRYTLFSTDDHLVEPPDMFEGRLPAKLQPLAPKVVETEEGHEVWHFDGKVYFQVGLNAVVGRKREDWKVEPTRFDEMRPGCYDVDARVRDMDINGVWASVNFPSQITGFCGSVFSRCSDPELGLAVTRAWNDWFHDEWHTKHPDRIVPMGVTFLADPEAAADEIRRNAARGFTGVTLPEMPHRIGMESIYSEWWDPIFARVHRDGDRRVPARGVVGRHRLPAGRTGHAARGHVVRPAVAERVRGMVVVAVSDPVSRSQDHHERGRHRLGRDAARPAREHHRPFGIRPLLQERPAPGRGVAPQLLVLDDRRPVDAQHRETVGIDHITFESDYPHGDGTWPDTQHVFADVFGGLTVDEIAKISHENAAKLFRHPLPPPGNPHAVGVRR